MGGLLVAATDTECGKTVLTCALAAYWQRYCGDRSLGILKPVQSGVGDRELFQQLFSPQQPLTELGPVWFEAPLAPPVAAALAGQAVDLAPAWQRYVALEKSCDWVLVEGLGGLGSPVTAELTIADLAAEWRLPTVLVVPVKLGAIANAVANVALARQHQLETVGIVLNCTTEAVCDRVDELAPPHLIERLTGVPVLGVLPHLSNPQDITQLSDAARQLILERIMPAPFWVV